MNVSNLPVTFRTIRHLRLSQVAARVARYGKKQRSLNHITPRPLALDDFAAAIPEIDHPCARGVLLLDALKEGRLPLLNQSLCLGTADIDWRLGAVSGNRLTAITLHYHQWLYELAKLCGGPGESAIQARRLFGRYLADWLESCDIKQPGAEALAWNSYAIATRLGWSVRAYRTLVHVDARISAPLMDAWLKSLWCQAAFLHANLEWDLRANHLLRDAVGLAWAGRFFTGRDADHWMRTATKLAVAQSHEQMLEDGAHFERSPFYHLEVMDDWLALAVLLRDESAHNKMRRTWDRAAEYACWLSHPDGRVVQFNDGAAVPSGPALSRGASLSRQVSLASPRGGRWLTESGVVAWHGDPWTLFWDVGDIGPDFQPGHAHADTLTLEASYRGQRLFVDPGCHSYDHDDRRKYDRSTIAHNTVCIDAQDSSEVWHIFRVGRRARPRDVSVVVRCDGFEGVASHSGYQHLSGRPRHQREVSVSDEERLRIVDTVTGAGRHAVEGGFLVHPDWDVEECKDGWALHCNDRRIRVLVNGSRPIALTADVRPMHPDYGVELLAKRLIWRFDGTLPLQVDARVEPLDRIQKVALQCSGTAASRMS